MKNNVNNPLYLPRYILSGQTTKTLASYQRCKWFLVN